MQQTKPNLRSHLFRGYSLKEVAAICGKSESTLYREIKAGKLETYKLGGSTRIRADELIRYCQAPSGATITQPVADFLPERLAA